MQRNINEIKNHVKLLLIFEKLLSLQWKPCSRPKIDFFSCSWRQFSLPNILIWLQDGKKILYAMSNVCACACARARVCVCVCVCVWVCVNIISFIWSKAMLFIIFSWFFKFFVSNDFWKTYEQTLIWHILGNLGSFFRFWDFSHFRFFPFFEYIEQQKNLKL